MTVQSGGASTIERAIQLAEDSGCASTADIRRELKREGHEGVDQHLSGPTFQKKLRTLMLARRKRAS